MAQTLCQSLHKQGLYVCLASHSTIDQTTQAYCDYFIYDSNNSFQLNGRPNRTDNHGVAEFNLIHSAAQHLKQKGFTAFFKVCFDNPPDIDYQRLVEQCQSTGKKMVAPHYLDNIRSLSTMAFYSEIEFFEPILNAAEINYFEDYTEAAFYRSINDKQQIANVHIADANDNFFGCNFMDYSRANAECDKKYPYVSCF